MRRISWQCVTYLNLYLCSLDAAGIMAVCDLYSCICLCSLDVACIIMKAENYFGADLLRINTDKNAHKSHETHFS